MLVGDSLLNRMMTDFEGKFHFQGINTEQIDTSKLILQINLNEIQYNYPFSMVKYSEFDITNNTKVFISPATYMTKLEYENYLKTLPKLPR